MPAMPSLSWSSAVVTYASPPYDLLTRSQRFRRGEFPDTRKAPPYPCLLRAVWQQTSWRPTPRVPALGPQS
jgi:hypothetical protein